MTERLEKDQETEEGRGEEKEVTSVEDVETAMDREETRGDPNLMNFIEQMNERLLKQINEKFDKNEKLSLIHI